MRWSSQLTVRSWVVAGTYINSSSSETTTCNKSSSTVQPSTVFQLRNIVASTSDCIRLVALTSELVMEDRKPHRGKGSVQRTLLYNQSLIIVSFIPAAPNDHIACRRPKPHLFSHLGFLCFEALISPNRHRATLPDFANALAIASVTVYQCQYMHCFLRST